MERYKSIKEKIVKKRVVRKGKRMLKKTTDKEGYKIDSQGHEVKMKAKEILRRKKAAKKMKISKRGKSTAAADRQRKRSMAKR